MKKIFLLFLSAIFLSPMSVQAGEEKVPANIEELVLGLPEAVIIDDVEYTRKEILERLFDAAIGDMTVNDEHLNSKLSKHITEETYPWAYPHINPEKGYPQPLSINKWMQPIKVSFGMPYNSRPFVSEVIEGKLATEYETWPRLDKKWIGPTFFYFSQRNQKMATYETYTIAENETKNVIKRLSPILPVSISYLDMEEETTVIPPYLGGF
ncbi:MAG: hypothetical protein KAJ29_04165 [Alphaproteobacteria bacterium]|nr:hypothetical protein [Alphaproteobacteria bacterium]